MLNIMFVGRNTVPPCLLYTFGGVRGEAKTTGTDLRVVTKMPLITGTITKPMTHNWPSSYNIARLVLFSFVAAFV